MAMGQQLLWSGPVDDAQLSIADSSLPFEAQYDQAAAKNRELIATSFQQSVLSQVSQSSHASLCHVVNSLEQLIGASNC